MDHRAGDAVQEEQETTVGGDAARAEEAAAPAVSGEPASSVKGNCGNDDNEGEVEEEDEGYRTPTSPRHRLRDPEVCPPAPRPRLRPVLMTAPRRRPRSVLMTAQRGRKRRRAERAGGGVLTWVLVGDDVDVLLEFCRRRRVGAGRPENVSVHW